MSSYKSSFNSPRSSPFRRPASPSSPTPVRTPQTPPSQRGASPMTSPSKLRNSYIASEEQDEDEYEILPLTPSRATTEPPPSMRPQSAPTSYTPNSRSLPKPQSSTPRTFSSSQDTLSRLPPPLLNSLRESFSVLDTTSDGVITPQSVLETLQSLGLSTTNTNLSEFFPPSQPSTVSLPQYLNSLANILCHLSPTQELLNAFSAFDDDDSGQIDVAELREALVSTVPDAGERALSEREVDRAMEGFTGRRILGRNTTGMTGIAGVRGMNGGNNTPMNKKQGDVFRYQDFVANLTGGPAQGQQQQGEAVRAQ